MSSKHQGGPAPVPPGNRSKFGTGVGPEGGATDEAGDQSDRGAGFAEQDPKRRLGGFESAGEHSRVQPGALNDGDTHSK